MWQVCKKGGILCVLAACVSLAAEAATLKVPGEYAKIQAAIDAAAAGDIVLVADGVYTGTGNRDIDLKGKAITLRSANGPAYCTIDCAASEENMHRGFVLHSGESRSAVIEGFTITNAVANMGAGILCTHGASPTIRGNVIRGNRVPWDCDGGGGIKCRDGAAPLIEGNIIEDNHCEPGSGGGGIHCYNSGRVEIRRNIIRGNRATSGGGIEIGYNAQGAEIANNLIEDNAAGSGAGVLISTATGEAQLCNNTIVNNEADYSGGGVRVTGESEATIINCVVWGNRADGDLEGAQIDKGLASVGLLHCCVEGWSGFPGVNGNFGRDPLFADAAAGDYRLRDNSPCVDSGLNDAGGVGDKDLDGNLRIQGRLVDMGAYETPVRKQTGAYRVIDLGTLGGMHSEAAAINNSGQIVGRADTYEGVGHACLFVHDKVVNIDLGTLGGTGSRAYDINNAGQIVGSSNLGAHEKATAVLFDATGGGANVDLGTAEERVSAAYGINDIGQIVGGTMHADGRWRATLFDASGGGNNINLGNLGEYFGNDDSMALAINSQGIIVGHAQYQEGSSIRAHGTRFDPSGAGANVLLGGLQAAAVNEAGQIVGAGDGQAMLFDATGGLENRTLGLPKGAVSGQAWGINAYGQVVGSVMYSGGEHEHAALFDASGQRGAIDLNTLIDPDCGWVLRCAKDINDKGWMVGYGVNPQGKHRAFLLVPELLEIIYVDDSATGANDGTSWADAFTHLQDALAAARRYDHIREIRVARGVYRPGDFSLSDRPSLGREETFALASGVTIKGGYAGWGAADADARDVERYATILSGDSAGTLPMLTRESYGSVLQARGVDEYTHCYHVVSAMGVDATAVLEGVTITGGTANGPSFGESAEAKYFCGAGVYVVEASPTLIDCTITGNIAFVYGGPAAKGGGMYCGSSEPTLVRCRFVFNWVDDYDSDAYGAGMMNEDSSPVLSDCVFEYNGTGNWAGGMANRGMSAPKLTGCTFAGNWSQYGGGAIGHAPFGDYVLTARNCLFAGNSTYGAGAAVDLSYPGGLFINCTFAENGFSDSPYDYAVRGHAPFKAVNCIFRDGGQEIDIDVPGWADVTFSNVEGGFEGVGNIDADPLFARPGRWVKPGDTGLSHFCWIAGDYHVMSRAGRWDASAGEWVQDEVTSPCIDAGDPMSPIMYEPFAAGGVVNMGAYGGTAEASKSYFDAPPCEVIVAGDINGDCAVNLADLAIMALHWLAP